MIKDEVIELIVLGFKDVPSFLFKSLKNRFKKREPERWLCGTPFLPFQPKEKDQYYWAEARGNSFIEHSPPTDDYQPKS